MNSRLYKVLSFVIGILTLSYMIYGLGVETIWANIQKTGVWFVPVIGSWVIIYGLNALAFKAIIQDPALPGSNLSFWSILKLTISGYAINYITPFVALGGEPYRVMELKPALGLKKATSSVLLYSLMHMFSHVLFWLGSIVLIIAFIPINDLVLAGCGAMLVFGLMLGYWFIKVYQNGFTVSTFRLLSRMPFVGQKIGAFAFDKAETLSDIDEQIRDFYSNRKSRFHQSLWLEFVARVVGCLEIYFTARAIGLNMTLIQSLVVSSGSSLFANLIFFFPMQLGTREGGLALALQSVGFPAVSGVFIGIVMRIRELVWIVIGLGLMNKTAKGIETKPDEILETTGATP